MSLAKQLINCTGPGWDFRNVKRMVATTAQWFSFLGDVNQPSKSFGTAFLPLGAVKEHPNSLRPLFCDLPEKLTAERMEELFQAKFLKGSN